MWLFGNKNKNNNEDEEDSSDEYIDERERYPRNVTIIGFFPNVYINSPPKRMKRRSLYQMRQHFSNK